jgi:hypothetical protein
MWFLWFNARGNSAGSKFGEAKFSLNFSDYTFRHIWQKNIFRETVSDSEPTMLP